MRKKKVAPDIQKGFGVYSWMSILLQASLMLPVSFCSPVVQKQSYRIPVSNEVTHRPWSSETKTRSLRNTKYQMFPSLTAWVTVTSPPMTALTSSSLCFLQKRPTFFQITQPKHKSFISFFLTLFYWDASWFSHRVGSSHCDPLKIPTCSTMSVRGGLCLKNIDKSKPIIAC